MSRPRTCVDCGTTEKVATFLLCDDCVTERTIATRAAQGLPTPSESDEAHAHLAHILTTKKPA